MAGRETPLVVKVGGSLADTGRLAEVLEIVSRATRPVTVVPGGGAYADRVRELQRATDLADDIAHRMAMLAMHEMAEEIVAENAAFVTADSLEAIESALASGGKPVWLPLPMMEGDVSVPANWNTTSDALAARLAELLGGADVALIKSVAIARGATAESLAAHGIVDPVFPLIVKRARLAWRAFGPGNDAALEAFLALSGDR